MSELIDLFHSIFVHFLRNIVKPNHNSWFTVPITLCHLHIKIFIFIFFFLEDSRLFKDATVFMFKKPAIHQFFISQLVIGNGFLCYTQFLFHCKKLPYQHILNSISIIPTFVITYKDVFQFLINLLFGQDLENIECAFIATKNLQFSLCSYIS